jgi:hypothetical protein
MNQSLPFWRADNSAKRAQWYNIGLSARIPMMRKKMSMQYLIATMDDIIRFPIASSIYFIDFARVKRQS